MPIEFSNEEIAMACHEINRIYCMSLNDFSQPHWEDAPDWQKKSAIQGVGNVLNSTKKPTPVESHDNWMFLKLKEGWRYGPKKDPEKKEHPCLVPYDYLPEEQKNKDEIFIAVVELLSD